jgi:N-acetylneuraminic acid mutarotase
MVYDPINQRVLMFGGQARIPDWTRMNDVWAYSPAANAWTQLLASVPTTP